MSRFLQAAMARAFEEHEAQLARARSLDELPDKPMRRAERVPPEPRQRSKRNRAVPTSSFIAIYRASQEEGVTRAELAERFGINERTLFRVLKKVRPRTFTSGNDYAEAHP